MEKYFPISLNIRFTPKKDENYILSCHPHGVWAMFLHPCMDAFIQKHGIFPTFFGAPILFKLPLLRRHFNAMNTMAATKDSMKSSMTWRYPYNICVNTTGGIEEMFYGTAGQEEIVLIKHKMKHGLKK